MGSHLQGNWSLLLRVVEASEGANQKLHHLEVRAQRLHSGREMDSLIVEDAKNLWTFLTYHRYLGINPTNSGQVDKTST